MAIKLERNIELQSYNTFGVSAKADYFVEVSTADELDAAVEQINALNLPMMVLGGGSNILLTQDFAGVVLKIAIKGKSIRAQTQQHIWLSVGAGENWHQLVQYTVAQGFAGLENLSLIPGTVGAAPIQNIGAYGVEFADVFESLTAFNLKTKATETFDKKAMAFGYRDSQFKQAYKNTHVITKVTMRLDKRPNLQLSYPALKDYLQQQQCYTPSLTDISHAVMAIRQAKLPDPNVLGNAGSFFKNPVITRKQYHQLKTSHVDLPSYDVDDNFVKLPAAWLIEHCGYKGLRQGACGVHDKQALVLVNHGGASGKAIWQLAQQIQQTVEQEFNIKLVPEVNIH